MNQIFLWIVSFAVAASFWGCGQQQDGAFQNPKAEPQIHIAGESSDPKLVVSPPRIMDLTSTHPTPDKIVAIHEANPYADFFLSPVASDKSSVSRGHVKFDRAASVNGKTLNLRGVTVRKFEMSAVSLLTIYTVGFYVDAQEDVETEIADTEKALVLEYHVDVDKVKVIEAIKENIDTNPKIDAEAVEPSFQQLSDAFDSPRRGDRYEFVYIPERGTAMIKAGKVLTVIQGREFQQAFFGIWLSPHGKDLDMRCELLAIPCPEKPSLNPVNLVSSGIGGAKEKLGKLKSFVSS